MEPQANLKTAKTAIQNQPFLKTAKYREQQGRALREGAHPEIVVFEKALIHEFKSRHMPFYAHNMIRGKAYQEKLVAQGRSKAKFGKSPHNLGCAVDIVHSLYHWEIDKLCWDIVGHIGKQVAKRVGVDVVWGGDWRFYDPAHWELRYWKGVRDQYPNWNKYFLTSKSSYWKAVK